MTTKTYRVFIDLEKEVEAEDENEAITQVLDDLAVENDSIENYLTAEEINKKE